MQLNSHEGFFESFQSAIEAAINDLVTKSENNPTD
jgi:hypothetical protein